MATQVIWGTLAKVTGGLSGTAPEMFVGSTDQTNAVITTAGAIADQYEADIFKVGDVLYINYDQDGTPGSNVYKVNATSGGSLEVYTEALGGALLAANNLSDVDSASTSRTNLGLGAADNVQFANVFAGTSGTAGVLRSYPSAATSGYLGLSGVANAGDYAVIINNASHGQASTYSIADSGVASSGFILMDSSGTQTIATGNLAMTAGYFQPSNANALTAFAGGGQASALQLAKQINRVTTVGSAGDSVKLPVSVAGRIVYVINAAAANAMDVFPQTGDAINALPANTALSVAANKAVMFICAVAGTWNSILTA